MTKANILVVDDDESFRLLIESQLKKAGYTPVLAESGFSAMDILETGRVDLILSDQVMPKMDGIELLAAVKSKHGDIPFIILTAYGEIKKSVVAMKKGAYDYIQKPYHPDDLLATINRTLDRFQLNTENKLLKDHLRGLYSFQNMVTRSPRMKSALNLAEKVSKNPRTTVTIYGESGTGKEVLARAIHFSGESMGKKFVAVNCAAIPSALLESELFGHVKGAFTGADKERDGKFALAEGGTILLDEIGDMPLELQAKLLRVLQERVYEKLGSNKPLKADCRVIIATHKNLEEMVRKGSFREDLYYRINVFPISIPPLRERKEDILLLADYFLGLLRQERGKSVPGLSKKSMDVLVHYHWHGNIRELKNCIERAVIIADNEFIEPEHLIISAAGKETEGVTLESANALQLNIELQSPNTSLESIINTILQKTLAQCGGNRTLAAKTLKINRKMFYNRF